MTTNEQSYAEQASRLMQVLADEDASAHEFGELFWALAWCRSSRAAAEPAASQAAEDALRQAHAALQAMALRAWRALLGCADLAGLGEAQHAICRVEALNSQLLAEPSSFGLPADLELPEFARPLEPARLGEWLAAAAIWQRAAQAEPPARRGEPLSRAQLTEAIVRLRELADTSRRLLPAGLPVPLAGEIAEAAPLSALQHAAARSAELADAVRKLLSAPAQQSPIAALAELERYAERARQAQPHWLTARYAARVWSQVDALEHQLRAAIAAWIAELLSTTDPDLAAQRLYQEMLLPCTTTWLADAVEAALRPYVQPAAPEQASRRGARPDLRLAQVRIIQLALSKFAEPGQAPGSGGL